MKSNYEQEYEKLIIHHISNLDICAAQRSSLFLDFFRNSETYYEDLCTCVYGLATGKMKGPMWMSCNGQLYLGTEPENIHDIFLTDCSEIPVFNGDILEQLTYVFTRIRRVSQTISDAKTHRSGCIGLY